MVSMKTSTLFCLKSAFLATLAIASTQEVEGPAITALAVADQSELEKRLYYDGEEVYFYTRTDSAGTTYFCGLVETQNAVLHCLQYDYFTSEYLSDYEQRYGFSNTVPLSAYLENPSSAEVELKTITSTSFVVPSSAVIAPTAATTSQKQSTEASTTTSRGEAAGSSQWASGFVGLGSLVAFVGLMI
ncbi:hypothetical protein WICPIJ_004792 [Wickerhamomyces pijperi]|uniref:Uncharacterized protein n=1 Tax=Wickerhamomyces pijperi TaxID=599730 RepID=A0A9P8Q774_WICPI|nr:hypothetical protein WICPIJ_004792 [Wickerhamomyces pijperi]